MRYRAFGRTGVQVSRLCLGAMMFGQWGNPDHDESIAVIHAALDAGINFIDTADVYSAGESEEIVAKAIMGRRDDLVLATKFFAPMGADRNMVGGSRRWIMRACEDSLRRLGTDHLDLYQVHRPDPNVDIDETLGALSDLVHQGKVRYLGSSTWPGSAIVEAQWVAERRNRERFVCEQPPYSILVRGIETDVLPTCSRHGMAVIPWSPLAGGWLSGKWRLGGETFTTHRANRIPARYDLDEPGNQQKLEAADALGRLADDAGIPLVHLAVAWVLRNPAVTSAIIGPRTMEQLTTQLGAADVDLADDVLDRIDEIVPPGTNFTWADAGYSPPMIADSRAPAARPMNAAEGTNVIQDLAARGHVIGDGRSTGASGGTYEHHNPATGVLQAEVPLGGADEVDAAVSVARDARATWRAVPLPERMAILFRLADLLDANDDQACAINALDNGTPVSAMRSGAYTAAWTRYYAGWIDKLDGEVVPVAGEALDVVLPEPYGVIGAIVPWNGPMMGMGQKAVPALAAGNTVVVKPPEIAPFGALRFAELALEAGLPPGALNVVVGGAAAGDALVRHPGVDKVSFTGGCATARLVMAAASETLTPLTFELGGKSANIVFPDADLDVATSMAAMLGAVLLSGQGCALPTRLYVHDDVYDDVIGRVVAQVEAINVGDPFDPAVLMGPVVSARSCERILGVIARATDEGSGTLLTGGQKLDGDLASGYFIAPTVFGDVDHDSSLAREEIFGPVLSVLRFRDEEEVVAKANDSDFGLSAYLHTRDTSRALRVARRLDVGTVIVNGFPAMSPGAPFGGVKQSGFGREGGRAGIEEFMRRKNVVLS